MIHARRGSFKADVQVNIKIYLKNAVSNENISIKLVSNPQGFNQIDKRWVDAYVKLWGMPDQVANSLKLFTGELSPVKPSERDSRRMFLDELSMDRQRKIIIFF